MIKEIDLITQDRSILRYIWLSATEGDNNQKLARLDHWPETELVENERKKLEAIETVWRDFYTGQRLDNWSKPYLRGSDLEYTDIYNCMIGAMSQPWHISWQEWHCLTYDNSCPCSYSIQPLLRLRGTCSPLTDYLFSPKQLPGNPGNMILLGQMTTRIEYNDTSSQWVLTDAMSDVTAVSRATKLSYLLGKHKWTISNDVYECNEGKPYTTMLKLTGCKEEGEFTCDDGQCIEMERRCDQVTGREPNCRDESDENGCQLIVFKNNYNKNIPPIGQANDGSVVPADVSISITLMKVVEIEEVEHSIHLQFEISLQWKEIRVKYKNLKDKTSLNALTDDDILNLWLPRLRYENTDQKVSTRLGEYGNGEWITTVTVTREGNFTRSGFGEVDEAELFEGANNRLTMNQTYTWEFQCKYKLQHYPFDTQVIKLRILFSPSQECKIEMGVATLASDTVRLFTNKVKTQS